ncbi:MAG: putative Tic20 family protein [Granulosicoccus sp.]|jgi:uncharacterized Tic20 family protein
MNEILDYDGKEASTNYRKWSFRFFIYLILLSGLGVYLIPSTISASETVIFSKKLLILGWVLKIFLCLGIFFIIMTIRNNETRDYKYWISLIGISLFFMTSIAFSFF